MPLSVFYYKPEFLDELIARDVNGNYTNKAQRYQYILKCLLVDENQFFKITEIQKYVIDKAAHLFNTDSKKPSELKRNLNHQFNNYLGELIKWGLVSSKEAKNIKDGGKTREYSLTKLGITFALIFDFLLSTEANQQQQQLYDKIFDNWKIYLNDCSTPLDLFCLQYLEGCKDLGLFGDFVKIFADSIISDTLHIKNMNDLFTVISLMTFDDHNKNKILFDLWKKSFNSLGEEPQRLFMHHLKTYINRMTATMVKDVSKYELLRFDLRHYYDVVIAECHCIGCRNNSSYKYIDLDVLYYISCIFKQPDEKVKEFFNNLKCEICKENKYVMTVVR